MLRAAAAGRAAKEVHEASGGGGGPEFTPADLAALEAEWSWLGSVVGPAHAAGPAALIDDDLAYVSPWGFEPAEVLAPTLILHGGQDRVVPSSHGEWLPAHCRRIAPRRTCGSRPKMGTSRSSPRPPPPWTGSAPEARLIMITG